MSNAGPPALELGLNLGTLRDLPPTELAALGAEERYAAIRAAGFVLVQDADDVLAAGAGLRSVGMGRVDRLGDAHRIASDGIARVYGCATLHVGTGFEGDAEADALIADIVSVSERLGFPLFVETHRATVTQDPWRTLQLVARHPGLLLNGDFSHWYTGVELVYGDLEAKLDALHPVFERVRFLHGRIGSPGCIQVDVTDDSDNLAIGHFREMWTRSFEAFLHTAAAGDTIAFLPELLPPANSYARTFRRDDGAIIEEGDRARGSRTGPTCVRSPATSTRWRLTRRRSTRARTSPWRSPGRPPIIRAADSWSGDRPMRERVDIATSYFRAELPLWLDAARIFGHTSSSFCYQSASRFIEDLWSGAFPISPATTQGYLSITRA
ncbi:tRNA-dependent cyclodipeptide synthase [Lacisediminihabitans sp.]|uniref:tRNA-dependent cyclodipeptide synthase n=1 Tax=Lacisediminihabitans sp. TaxID=2787631 RepID=UPI00374D9151